MAGKKDQNSENDLEFSDVVEQEKAKPKLKRPSRYKVIINNDDYTTMEFVVHVLRLFFKMHAEEATRTMLDVHIRGKAICGIFSREIAETRVDQVNRYAQENKFPLLCTLEPE